MNEFDSVNASVEALYPTQLPYNPYYTDYVVDQFGLQRTEPTYLWREDDADYYTRNINAYYYERRRYHRRSIYEGVNWQPVSVSASVCKQL